MFNVKVLYEESGEGGLVPVWMIIDCYAFDWERTFFIDINAPFERLTFDELDETQAAITVPDFAYTLHNEIDNLIGIVLPIVKDAALTAISPKPTDLDLADIRRLILRIGDVEDTLQYDIRTNFKY